MSFSPVHLGRLASADLFDEWPVAFAVSLAIAAVLAPLLVLSGLQSGIVGEIFDRLRADPSMRRITLDATGARRFDAAWFEAMRARPDVAFVMPSTRFAAAQVDITPAEGDNLRPLRVSLTPTGPGDPVFGGATPGLDTISDVLITAAVAEQTGLTVGNRLFLDVERRRSDGRIEASGIDATVRGVAAAVRHGGTVVFVRPELLRAIEGFRDGYAAPELGAPAGEAHPESDVFPSFRLYASAIEDVSGLARYLRNEQDLSVSTQEVRIGSAIELDRNIGAVLNAIIILGVVGLAGSLAAIQWAAAARKRRTVAMLALIGYGRSWLVGFPVTQAVFLAASGIVLGSVLAWGASLWINSYFAGSFGAEGQACRITGSALAVGAAGVLFFSLTPAALIGLHFNRLEPSNEIRDM
ncbi:MAG: FtsX-like permease family protein [Minwuia sp.]|uniref:FtsX-like permease family protein n=1 Tax=Minwuia sp. TaxID=2493630 RepID=UPI003A878F5B